MIPVSLAQLKDARLPVSRPDRLIQRRHGRPRRSAPEVREVAEPEPMQPPAPRLEKRRQRRHVVQRPQARSDQITPAPVRPGRRAALEP